MIVQGYCYKCAQQAILGVQLREIANTLVYSVGLEKPHKVQFPIQVEIPAQWEICPHPETKIEIKD